MKSLLITGFIIIMAILLILIFGFSSISGRDKSEESWDVSDGVGSVNGTWGTEIIVEYEDGSTENLNEPLPILSVSFGDKKVSNFKYVLSSRGTSVEYNAIEIDMSDFEVQATIKDQEEQWGVISSSDIVNLDMDGNWYEVYSIQVDASELEVLDVDKTYNLSFVPSGSITYRGSSSGSWTYVPLPNWFYLIFNVIEEDGDEDSDEDSIPDEDDSDDDNDGIPDDQDDDDDDDGIPDDDEDKWIQVELGSSIEF